ncbi:MAG: hypothetical protein IJS91_03235 [Bacteroidales bacterium]|jgi:hypothetical protein|nr:hypothetical protein [Bacteroidales bacterium]
MKQDVLSLALVPMGADELCAVRGGVDKHAQEALWMVGYVIGIIAKVFTSLFSLIKGF